jgi:hypothetical protein
MFNRFSQKTLYGGTTYDSRHEARFKVICVLSDISSRYHSFVFPAWEPDFGIIARCPMCGQLHYILVEVKPLSRIEDFERTSVAKYVNDPSLSLPCDAVMLFGVNPGTCWIQWRNGHGLKHRRELTASDLFTNPRQLWSLTDTILNQHATPFTTGGNYQPAPNM